MGNWIDVNDRLPDENVKVLVFGEQMGMNPQMGGAYVFVTERIKLSYQKHNLHLRNQFDKNDFRRASYVTHWMPLPKPPVK